MTAPHTLRDIVPDRPPRQATISAPGTAPANAGCPAAGLSKWAVFGCVFLPFAFGHYLSLLLRNINSLLAPSLVGSLALTPGELGLLTSAFFFTYALMQLPVGLALDRFGPRRVQLVLMLTAACGALLFARGRSFGELVVARAVIGIGLAGCFMSAVKAMSSCVAPSKLPSINGYLLAVGGIGSASATLPVRLALHYTDWRGLFVALAALTAVGGMLAWLMSPPAQLTPDKAKPPTLASLRDVYRHPQFRRTVSLILVSHTVFFGIQGLWLGRWLSDVAHYNDAVVAYLLYLSMAAVIFGAIAVGLVTEWAARHGVKPLDVAYLGVGMFVLVQALMMLGYRPSMEMLVVLFTLVGSITGMEYTIVAQSVPRELTGRAATCLNLLIFVGSFVVQAGFGWVIGLWHTDRSGHYPAIAYQFGFCILIVFQLPGLVSYWRTRRRVESEGNLTNRRESMRLVRYGRPGKEKPGLFDEEGRLRDLSGVIADIDAGVLSERTLRKIAKIDYKTLPKVAGTPRLGVPVKGVGKFIGIGMNYADHAAETGAPVPKEPIFFMKAISCLSGPDDPIQLPRGSRKTDWEVELGVVIGTRAQYVEEADALKYVAGYCVVNDVSERAYQFELGSQWDKGKGCDTFGPVGPFLVTKDEIFDVQDLDLYLELNGKRMQTGNTSNMVFTVAQIVSYVSRFMTLEPGDIICTGTPPGVGLGRSPQRFLRKGDKLRLGIAGLGEQQQEVIAYPKA